MGCQLWSLSHHPDGLVPFGSLCAKPRPLKRTGCRENTVPNLPFSPLSRQHGAADAGLFRSCGAAAWAVFTLHADRTWEAQKNQPCFSIPSPVCFLTLEVLAVWEGGEVSAFSHFLFPFGLAFIPCLSRFCVSIICSFLFPSFYPSDNQRLPPSLLC